MEKIIIGSTRAGLTLKKDLIAHLESKGFQVDDAGMKADGKLREGNRGNAKRTF